MSAAPTLLAVPNVSEGRDRDAIRAIAAAFEAAPHTRLLDVHSDPDHHRSVFTIAGAPGTLAQAVLRGAERAAELIDLSRHDGEHPRVGAIDVAPIVHLTEAHRGAACAEALVLGDLLGSSLQIPVFLYGALAGGRTRAEIRSGGPASLQARIDRGELTPDFGPSRLHVTAGATLVAARPPLIAFNVELAPPATLARAKEIAALMRVELPGVKAIGLWLEHRGVAQVSTNVEDHETTSLAKIVAAVESQAPIVEAELVGLAPKRAFEGFPDHIRLRNRATIEDALGPAP